MQLEHEPVRSHVAVLEEPELVMVLLDEDVNLSAHKLPHWKLDLKHFMFNMSNDIPHLVKLPPIRQIASAD